MPAFTLGRPTDHSRSSHSPPSNAPPSLTLSNIDLPAHFDRTYPATDVLTLCCIFSCGEHTMAVLGVDEGARRRRSGRESAERGIQSAKGVKINTKSLQQHLVYLSSPQNVHVARPRSHGIFYLLSTAPAGRTPQGAQTERMEFRQVRHARDRHRRSARLRPPPLKRSQP